MAGIDEAVMKDGVNLVDYWGKTMRERALKVDIKTL